MKRLNQFITEYIVKKKLDKFIDSEYNSYPKTKKELIENIEELINKDIYDLNCIDTSAITDMSNLFKELKINKTKYTVDVSKWKICLVCLVFTKNLIVICLVGMLVMLLI